MILSRPLQCLTGIIRPPSSGMTHAVALAASLVAPINKGHWHKVRGSLRISVCTFHPRGSIVFWQSTGQTQAVPFGASIRSAQKSVLPSIRLSAGCLCITTLWFRLHWASFSDIHLAVDYLWNSLNNCFLSIQSRDWSWTVSVNVNRGLSRIFTHKPITTEPAIPSLSTTPFSNRWYRISPSCSIISQHPNTSRSLDWKLQSVETIKDEGKWKTRDPFTMDPLHNLFEI